VRDPATTDAGALLGRLGHGLRPLTRISYFLDAHVYGMHAWGFLATNLLAHVATALLVFALARRRAGIAGACVGGILFALQPTHGEVVAYVSGRSTGLMTMLVIGALVLHDRGRPALAVTTFVLACLAKEVALVFPLLVVVWEATGGSSWRHCLRETRIYAIAAVTMFALLMAFANHRSILAYSLELRSMPDSLVANGHAALVMISLWARPWALSVDHDLVASHAFGVAGLVLLSAALAGALAARRRSRNLAFAVAWTIVALLPTTSIIAKLDLVTEKPLYLAWVGPAVAAGVAFSALRSRSLAFVTAGAIIVASGIGSAWRARMWRDPIALWEEATLASPNKSRCWNNLGMAYLAASRDGDAIAAFERALALDPGNEDAANNLEVARLLDVNL